MKDCLLFGSSVANVLNKEVEEARDDDGLVAISNDLVVKRFGVEEVGEAADDSVDGHHEEHSNDVLLL